MPIYAVFSGFKKPFQGYGGHTGGQQKKSVPKDALPNLSA